jgi:glycerol-3-phosphate acyltransferase PlsY
MILEFGLYLFAYLLGSIPSGILIAKQFSLVDPRSYASGNIGASNMTRLGGKKIGVITLVADLLKGAIPTLICCFFFPGEARVLAIVGFLAVFGHCFPIYTFFLGGKGVATSIGVLIFFSPIALGLWVTTWLITFGLSKITSLAALISNLAALALLFTKGVSIEIIYSYLAITALIYFRHAKNIRDLWLGTERSFKKQG